MNDRLAEIEERLVKWTYVFYDTNTDDATDDVEWLIAEVKRLRQENLALQHQRIYGAEMAYDLPESKK